MLVVGLFSCRNLAPNRMLLSKEVFPLATDSLNTSGPYVISPFDHLDLKIFSNDGFKLVDITGSNSATLGAEGIEYVVNQNGDVKFPVIGTVNVKGLTIEQTERMLETRYEKYYNQPFVHVKVLNRSAIVFLGEKGQVVPLNHDNTTLFEVLALAGGLTEYDKAYRIRIIRGDPKNPTIYQADISSMAGVNSGNVKILSNDIIHVDAVPNYGGRIYQRAFPIVGLLTSVLLLITLLNR